MYLGSIGIDIVIHFVRELCYKGAVLQRNYRKMTILWSFSYNFLVHCKLLSGLEVIKLEFILKLKIKHNDWLLADTCLQAANHCALF